MRKEEYLSTSLLRLCLTVILVFSFFMLRSNTHLDKNEVNATSSQVGRKPISSKSAGQMRSEEIIYSDDRFLERADYPGRMVNNIYLDLESSSGITFNGPNNVLSYSYYSITNVPSGLTFFLVKHSSTRLMMYFTGTATNHEHDDDVEMELSLNNSLFSNGNAAAVTGYTNTIKVNFAYFIESLTDLQLLSETSSMWDGLIYQTSDIDAQDTQNWNGGAGFSPIGNPFGAFTGVYDGQGHTISNLFINLPEENYIGFFGYFGGTVSDLGIKNADITGDGKVGGLVGYVDNDCTLTGSYSSGEVTGIHLEAGGLIGNLSSGLGTVVQDCYSVCSVSSPHAAGGFVGIAYTSAMNCYAAGLIGEGGVRAGFCGFTGSYLSFPGCFWNTETSNQTVGLGGQGGTGVSGITTLEMRDHLTFENAGWDLILETTNGEEDIWDMDQGIECNNGFPILNWQEESDEYLVQYFSGGYGTEESPWEISTLEDLKYLAENINNGFASDYFIQTEDIDASATAEWNDEGTTEEILEGFLPIGNHIVQFEGNYNGNGHLISDLTINRINEDYIGFFGEVEWAYIYDLGLEDVNINGNKYVGGFLGSMSFSTISRCYTNGEVFSENEYCGGFAGRCYSSHSSHQNEIYDCYTRCNVSSNSNYIGGFMGYTLEVYVYACYSTGLVTGVGTSYVEAFCGYEYNGNFSFCYYDEETTGIEYGIYQTHAGIDKLSWEMKIHDTFSSWDFVGETAQGEEDIWDMDQEWTINDGYPILSWQDGADAILDYSYGGGSGIDGDPWLINDLQQLGRISNHIEDFGCYFLQTADIDATDTENWNDGKGFIPIGDSDYRFTGCYDGGEHVITGLYINNDSGYTGFFGFIDDAEISRLGLAEAELIVSGAEYYNKAGVLAGHGQSYPVIRECFTSGTIVDSTLGSESVRVGGLCGYSTARFHDCYSRVDINSENDYIGGLNGYGVCRYYRCYFAGYVTADFSHTGGLSGDDGNSYDSFWNLDLCDHENRSSNDVGYGLSTTQMQSYRAFTNTDRIQLDNAWDFVGNEYNDTGTEDIWDMDQDGIINDGLPIFSWQPGGDNVLPDSYQFEGSGGEGDPWLLEDIDDFQYISEHNEYWKDHLALTGNIDASDSQNWNSGEGFSPIGNAEYPFMGSFDGQGHVISNIYINRPAEDYQAPFGVASSARFFQLGFDNICVYGDSAAAGFVAALIDGSLYSYIDECYTKGEVHATEFAGGFAAYIYKSQINDSYTRCYLEADDAVGGFASNYETYTLRNCYSAGEITCSGSFGGFLNTDYRSATFCFFDRDVCGTNTSASGTGKTTNQMHGISTYTNYLYNDYYWWDFVGNEYNDVGNDDIWDIDQNGTENDGYPILSWEEGADELVYPPTVLDLPETFSFNEDDSYYRRYFSSYFNDYYDEVETLGYTGNSELTVEITQSNFYVDFSAPANWNGSEVITFTLYNAASEEISSDTVQVIVNSLNDPPEFAADIPDVEFLEDETAELDFSDYITDVDAMQSLSEEFSSMDFPPSGWFEDLDGSPLSEWRLNAPLRADFESACCYTSTITGSHRLILGPVSTAGSDYMELSFYSEIDLPTRAPDNAGMWVETSSDGMSWNVVYDVSGNYIEPGTVVTAINNDDVGSETFYLAFNYYLPETGSIGTWFVDDVVLDYGVMPTLSVSDNADIIIEISGLTADFSAPENWNGSETVTFTIDDNQTRATDNTEVNVTVTPVNDPPVIDLPDTWEFAEDGELVIDCLEMINDVDTPDSELTLSYSGNTDITAAFDGLEITLTATENWHGTETLTFTVDDNVDRLTASDDVEITVTPVNDPPVIDLPETWSFAEDEQKSVNFADLISDVDNDDSELTLSYAGNENIAVEISRLRLDVIFTATENWHGTETLTFTVDDNVDRLTASDDVVITVTPVNDPPVIDLPDTWEFAEDGELAIDCTAMINDVDNPDDELILSYSGNTNIAVEIAGLQVTLTAPDNWFGSEYITFTISDEEGRAEDSDLVAVTVYPINDAPVIALPATCSFDEDGSLETDYSDYISDADVIEEPFELTENFAGEFPPENWFVEGNSSGTAGWNQYEADFTGAESPIAVFSGSSNDSEIHRLILGPVSTSGIGELELEFIYRAITGNSELLEMRIETSNDGSNWHNVLTLPDYSTTSSTKEITIANPDVGSADFYLSFTFEGVPDEILNWSIDNILLYQYSDSLTLTASDYDNITPEIDGFSVIFSSPENWNGTEDITFTVYDSVIGREMASDQIAVTVDYVNDAPTVETPLVDFSFDEDTTDDHIDLDDVFSDLDLDYGDELSYTYSGNTHIGVDITEGVVTFTPEDNWNGSETITFRATDNYDQFVEDEVEVTINYVNDAPTVENALVDFEMDEDTTDNHIDLDDVFTDLDLDYGDELSYTYSGNTHIGVDITEGVVTFTPEDNWNGSETITFRATDNYDQFIEDDVIVTIDYVNDAPTVETALVDFSFDEDTTDDHIDLNDVFTDLDLDYGDELSYTYSGNEHIGVDITEGVVTFTPDDNWNGSETVTFRATDSYDQFIEDEVEVTINYINDPPTVENALVDFNMDENTTDDHVNLDDIFTDLDLDYGDELSYTYSGNTHIGVDITEGVVTFTPEDNWNGSETITFRATDNYDQFVEDDVIVTIDFVNDAPTVETALVDFSFDEDTTDDHIDLNDVFTDPDLDYGDELSYTYSGNEHIGVDITEGVVTFTPEDNWNGSETITFRATDSYDQFVEDDVIVTINYVNDAPTVETALADFSFDEDTTDDHIDLDDVFTDLDLDYGDELSYTYSGNEHIGVDITEGVVTFTPEDNWNGSETITFRATDNYDQFIEDDVIVTIDYVNDAPTVETALVDFSFDEDTTDDHIDLNEVFTDLDLVYGDELSYTYSGNEHIGVDITEGVVTFTPEDNWNGSETITFRATDEDEEFIEDDLEVTINYVNDAPTVENAIADFDFDEDTSDDHIDLDNVFTDLDLDYGDELSYTYSGNDSIDVSIVEGVVTLTPQPNWYGSETITFTATDNDLAEVSDEVIVTVNPVNDDPVINLPILLSYAEDGSLIEDFEPWLYDVDGDELLLTCYGNDEIDVDINNLVVTFTSPADWWGDDDMVFTVNDQQGRAIASQEILIMVTPVNDQPVIELPDSLEFVEDGSLIFDFSPYVNDADDDELSLSCEGNQNIAVQFNGLSATFTAVENWNGAEVISFTVDDGNDATASDECTITVTPENDDPVFELPETLSFDEDDILIEDFSAYINDIDSGNLTLSTSGGNSITVSIDDMQVTFSAPANWNGSEIISFTIDDNATRATASDQVTITVNYVNDAPYVANPLTDINMNEDSSYSFSISNVFADLDLVYGDQLSYAAQETDHIDIDITGSVVTITPDANWFGSETLIFTATDSYDASVSDEMTVTVENIVDYPQISYWLENPSITEEDGDYFYEFEVFAASEEDTRFISSMLYLNYDPAVLNPDITVGFGASPAGILVADEYYTASAAAVDDYFAVGTGWDQEAAEDFNYDNAVLLSAEPQLIMHVYLPLVSGMENEQIMIYFTENTPLSQQTYFTTESTNDWTAYNDMVLYDMDYTIPEFTNLELTANEELIDGFTIELDWNTEYYLGTSENTDTNIALADTYQPFYYTNTPDGFFTYWQYKGVTESAAGWQGHMWQIISGNEPIFYLKPSAENPQSFLLIDGLMRDFAGENDPILHLPGDFPRGDYTFSGDIISNYLMRSDLDLDLTMTTLPGSIPSIAVPSQVSVTDVTPDQGGWLSLSYYPSENDIYHANTRAPYVNGYVLQQGIDTDGQTIWTDILDFAPSADYDEVLFEIPASDIAHQYRLAAYLDDNYSGWADAGSAAPADNMGIYANITVILEGAYRSATGMMQSNLDLPLTSPYDGEVINELPQADIIDWIQISLHSSSTSAAVESCSAFLLSDGTIVNTEGEAELPLYYTTCNPYYLVINHRNHIPVMSSDTYILADEEAQAVDIDLTAENDLIGDGIKDMGTFKALYAGDVDGDGFIGATDMNIWAVNYTSSDYIGSDIDLDGLVGATDANIWAVNWSKGSSIPFQRDEQAAGSFSTHNLATANNIYYYLTEPELVEYPGGDIYCECDIIATCDQPSRFLTGQLFIGYNTEVFGTLAAENYNLWASAGELIDTQVDLPGPAPEINAYSIMSADYDKTTLTVGSVWNPQAVTMMTYENTSQLLAETNWLHIALKVENPQSEYEQLLWLEHNELADNQQTYLDHNSNWHSYSGIEYGAPQILTGNAPENRISGVYPNPFNPSTSIHFYLEDAAEVELNIYNIKGQKVNTITAGSLPSGAHSINWNGTNPNNRTCASGVYFFQLTAGAKTETYRALMLK